jgi:hypothetical protein
MAWRESALPLKRVGNINPMDEFCGEPRLRRFTDGIVLRVSTPDPAGVELSVCDFRLEGPKGVLPLDGDSPATWSGKPSVSEGPQGQRSVSWKFPRGVSKVEAKALYRGDIDLQEYSTLKYRWRLSGAKDDPRPLILWTMSQGRQNAQFQCQLLPLAPTLEQSAVEPRGGDGHGLMRFSEWFTFDSAAERRLVLTQEGVLVVRDEFHPGKSALGRSVGPIWHLGPRGEPERGVNYFNAKGAPVELLVAFSQAPHRVCDVQTVDVWSITGQKTAFAKEKIVGTAPMIFTSVLIPHAPGLAAKTIAESLVITEEGGTTVVRLRLEKTTLRIVLGPAGEWKVERGG